MSVPPFMARDPRADAMTIEGSVVELIPGKTDQMRAVELKAQAMEAIVPFLRLMDEAARDGFLLRWQVIAPNAYGRHEMVDVNMLKRF